MNLGGEMGVSAIIPGAGESVRFSRHGAPVSPMDRKQFKLLGDQPLIFVSLETFLKSDLIGSVVLVVPEDLVAWMVDAVGERQFEKEVKVVGGGEERQQSVRNGLDVVSSSCDAVVVHDAVRPFVQERWIKETVDLCSRYDGAIVAIRATDTLKRVSEHTVSETLFRTDIWHAQTPQTFRVDALLSAFEYAGREGIVGSDESQLVELNGGRVAVVEGSPHNIKITTPEDWNLAESIRETMNRG